MRVTAEGRVGIGTKTPETTLDVAGTIKARGGIQFDDGSVLNSAKSLSPSKDAPSGSAGGNNLSGTNIVTAINDPATAGAINDNRVSLNLARLSAANTWTSLNVFSSGLSANNAQITLVSGADVLSRLRGIDVSTWNYIAEGKNVRHMGPMAEDFFKAFNLGTGNASIGVQDLTGVSLAAIKELDKRTAEVEQLREQVNQLEQRLATLEQLLKNH
jgi:hypothetical protein